MGIPGYQDWAKYRTPSADSIVSGTVPATTNYSGPIVDCSTWQGVIVEFSNNSTTLSLTVTIIWEGYTSSIQSEVEDVFVVGPNQFASVALPCRGRTMQLLCAAGGATIDGGPIYGIVGLSHAMTKYDAKADTDPLFADNFAYGAAQSRTLTQNYWYEGPVLVSAFSNNGTNAYLEFQFVSRLSGTWSTLAVVGVHQAYGSSPVVVNFPPTPVRLIVHNDGAAQDVLVAAMPAATL